jgi:hypothetical protein
MICCLWFRDKLLSKICVIIERRASISFTQQVTLPGHILWRDFTVEQPCFGTPKGFLICSAGYIFGISSVYRCDL